MYKMVKAIFFCLIHMGFRQEYIRYLQTIWMCKYWCYCSFFCTSLRVSVKFFFTLSGHLFHVHLLSLHMWWKWVKLGSEKDNKICNDYKTVVDKTKSNNDLQTNLAVSRTFLRIFNKILKIHGELKFSLLIFQYSLYVCVNYTQTKYFYSFMCSRVHEF